MDSKQRSEGIEIEIDLRSIRAEAERSGDLAEHAVRTTEVSRDIRSVVATQAKSHDPVVTVEAMGGTELPPKFGLPQIIDAIGIVLAPIGVGGLAKLIIEIVKICRTKLIRHIRVKWPEGEGEIEISGPDVTPDDVRKLQRMLAKSPRKRKVRIEAVAQK
jgi:hypothetical protein